MLYTNSNRIKYLATLKVQLVGRWCHADNSVCKSCVQSEGISQQQPDCSLWVHLIFICLMYKECIKETIICQVVVCTKFIWSSFKGIVCKKITKIILWTTQITVIMHVLLLMNCCCSQLIIILLKFYCLYNIERCRMTMIRDIIAADKLL